MGRGVGWEVEGFEGGDIWSWLGWWGKKGREGRGGGGGGGGGEVRIEYHVFLMLMLRFKAIFEILKF